MHRQIATAGECTTAPFASVRSLVRVSADVDLEKHLPYKRLPACLADKGTKTGVCAGVRVEVLLRCVLPSTLLAVVRLRRVNAEMRLEVSPGGGSHRAQWASVRPLARVRTDVHDETASVLE